MIKKIASKYTLFIVLVFIAVTAVFVPVYMLVQQTLYIRFESGSMSDFCDSLVQSVDFSDSDALESYVEENNEDHLYRIILYGEDRTRLFSSGPHRKRPIDDPANNLTDKYIEEYSENSVPKYRTEEGDKRNVLVLRKIIYNHGNKYYIRIQESLHNIESVFSYTNRMLGIILILYVCVCGISMYILMRGMTGSIRSLNEVVQKISKKDYSVRFEKEIAKDEVGMLADNFNHMVDMIQDNITSLDNYNFLLKDHISHMEEYEEMRNSFVRNATHELKTPLAIISSQIEMMHMAKEQGKVNYYYDSAMEEIQNMSMLITKLLKYSVEEGHTLKAEPVEINLSQRITELCEKIAPVLHAKKKSFSYKIEEECILSFPELHVEYIFNNYMMNAMRYTGKNAFIQVALEKNETGYLFSVYNDGGPIPEEQSERIWTELYRMGEDQTDGTGLGLFIVKEIALTNHMDCGVENEKDGVRFWFEFAKVMGKDT